MTDERFAPCGRRLQFPGNVALCTNHRVPERVPIAGFWCKSDRYGRASKCKPGSIELADWKFDTSVAGRTALNGQIETGNDRSGFGTFSVSAVLNATGTAKLQVVKNGFFALSIPFLNDRELPKLEGVMEIGGQVSQFNFQLRSGNECCFPTAALLEVLSLPLTDALSPSPHLRSSLAPYRRLPPWLCLLLPPRRGTHQQLPYGRRGSA